MNDIETKFQKAANTLNNLDPNDFRSILDKIGFKKYKTSEIKAVFDISTRVGIKDSTIYCCAFMHGMIYMAERLLESNKQDEPLQ